MVTQIAVSNDELAALDALLAWKIDSMLLELRHTDTRSYKDELRHQMDILEHVLENVRQAQAKMGTASPTT